MPPERELRAIEERLRAASEAAERLISQAAGAAGAERQDAAREGGAAQRGAPREPPPAGWQTPADGDGGRGELEVLIALWHSVRDLIPPELERRLAEALRELLLALRALIDWYLERSERRRTTPSEVRDIPIE